MGSSHISATASGPQAEALTTQLQFASSVLLQTDSTRVNKNPMDQK